MPIEYLRGLACPTQKILLILMTSSLSLPSSQPVHSSHLRSICPVQEVPTATRSQSDAVKFMSCPSQTMASVEYAPNSFHIAHAQPYITPRVQPPARILRLRYCIKQSLPVVVCDL